MDRERSGFESGVSVTIWTALRFKYDEVVARPSIIPSIRRVMFSELEKIGEGMRREARRENMPAGSVAFASATWVMLVGMF